MKKNLTTQEKLLQATFEEVYQNGYHGTGLSAILKKANVNKGSMYHLYKSKKELMLDVIDKVIKNNLSNKYASLLTIEKNIIDELLLIIKDTSKFNFIKGCPLNNLIQELSPSDKDFKDALEGVYLHFENIIKIALDKAIAINEIKKCDTKKLSMFIAALIEGALITAKKSQNEQNYLIVINQLELQLQKL
ncbi:TetR/AcrR family transcriptional regulator [Sulfurovum sp.]|uniref:TetR/AcrR family transcriptional regulator n=1 Tax=Sulfurovum sp. TaxID=1969726 RepID=UPI0025CD3031|nr:TetR/AcrR family transcriptional regulator [Sulfurovum sp.]